VRSLPLLSEHPRPVQFVLVIVLPVVFGGLTGYFLGVSEAAYLILSVSGIAGGIGAGFDHLGAGAGARRGLLAGLLFGGSILVAHEIHGAEAQAELPDPAILLLAVTAVLGSAFGAIGGALRRRVTGRDADIRPEA
jgi:hypothetical protein